MKIVNITKLNEPKFIKTFGVDYEVNEKINKWEMVERHDSVHVLVHDTSKDELILVKQNRVPALVKTGIAEVIECCAGIVDKYEGENLNTRLRKIAVEEVREEIGYVISTDDLIQYAPILSSVGTSGSSVYLFSCKIDENTEYLGQLLGEHENIEVYRIKAKDAKLFLLNETRTDTTTKLLISSWLLERI